MKYALFISVLLHGLLWGGARFKSSNLLWVPASGESSPVYVAALRAPVVVNRSQSKIKGATSTSSTVKNLSPEFVAQAGNVAPAYPLEAERAGWEGEVLLHLKCDERGKVIDSRVEKSSGYQCLDESARDQSLQWRFLPEQVGREATIPVLFQLD